MRRSLIRGFFALPVFLSAIFILNCTKPSEKPPGPAPGREPLSRNGEMRISAEDRCPVCAMNPIKYPKFSSAIQLTDGRTFYFCGTSCMIKSWMHPEVYLGAEKKDIGVAVVRDYFTGKQMDAREAFWVAGSDIIGPMGPALVPVAGRRGLETFKNRHGGEIVFRLDEMNDRMWEEVTGRK